MWLTVAQRRASGADEAWITELQERSFSLAEESVRRRSASLAESWMQANPSVLADSRQ